MDTQNTPNTIDTIFAQVASTPFDVVLDRDVYRGDLEVDVDGEVWYVRYHCQPTSMGGPFLTYFLEEGEEESRDDFTEEERETLSPRIVEGDGFIPVTKI